MDYLYSSSVGAETSKKATTGVDYLCTIVLDDVAKAFWDFHNCTDIVPSHVETPTRKELDILPQQRLAIEDERCTSLGHGADDDDMMIVSDEDDDDGLAVEDYVNADDTTGLSDDDYEYMVVVSDDEVEAILQDKEIPPHDDEQTDDATFIFDHDHPDDELDELMTDEEYEGDSESEDGYDDDDSDCDLPSHFKTDSMRKKVGRVVRKWVTGYDDFDDISEEEEDEKHLSISCTDDELSGESSEESISDESDEEDEHGYSKYDTDQNLARVVEKLVALRYRREDNEVDEGDDAFTDVGDQNDDHHVYFACCEQNEYVREFIEDDNYDSDQDDHAKLPLFIVQSTVLGSGEENNHGVGEVIGDDHAKVPFAQVHSPALLRTTREENNPDERDYQKKLLALARLHAAVLLPSSENHDVGEMIEDDTVDAHQDDHVKLPLAREHSTALLRSREDNNHDERDYQKKLLSLARVHAAALSSTTAQQK